MKTRILYLVCFCLLRLLFSNSLQAQCDKNAIIQAEEDYLGGHFEKVVTALSVCAFSDVKNKSTQTQVAALAILAETFVALDSVNKAQLSTSRLIQLNYNFQASPNASFYFRELIKKEKKLFKNSLVSSASKIIEKPEEAPASIIVITEEEIKRRGYIDLEMLLHDLPGFDISQSNGITYSSIYQRGCRSNNTNRILLLVDGVEDNDLWGNIMYLSRQYAMSNIKSVEVIYGPASTMYGANAYTGVISINTKSPSDYIKGDNKIGVSADVGYGAWQTKYLDATIAMDFPRQNTSIALTTRLYQSNEADFSGEYWQDFNTHSLNDPFTPLGEGKNWEDLYRSRMEISDNTEANAFYQNYSNHTNAGYFNLNVQNGDSSITLTNAGLNQVVELENELMSKTSYSDKTNAGAFTIKVNIGNLKLGWQYWYKEEGVGVWFNDVRQAGTNEGQYWSPYSNFFYARYDKQLNNHTNFTSFTRYKLHGYLASNALVNLEGYTDGHLGLSHLLDDTQPSWSLSGLTTRSNQMRHENRLSYHPNDNFSMVSGLELRYSAIQDNYAFNSTDGSANTQNHYFFGDGGLYTQIRYQIKDITFTGGLRYDYNSLLDTTGYGNNASGYGNQFNPRLAIVYHPGKYVFKAIFATAFKDATNFDRYSTVIDQRDLANPALNPERVFNYEISARRFLDKNRRSSIEVLGYFADYTSVIVAKKVNYNTSITTQFQNSGFRQVFGIQGWVNYHHLSPIGKFYFYANYTFTNPQDLAKNGNVLTDSYGDTLIANGQTVDQIRVGDIAKHQVNFGVNYQPTDAWNINLRGNFVGNRPTGEGTTITANQDDFPAYVVFNSAVSYTFKKYGLTIQGVVNNVLNENYYSPGLRVADNYHFSSSLPQKRRNIHLRIRLNI